MRWWTPRSLSSATSSFLRNMADQAMIGPFPVVQATYPTALSALFSNLPLSVDFASR